jgi:hypothetical protein
VDDRLLTILQTAHQFNLTTGLLYTAGARGELATIRLPPRARIRVRETDVRGWTDGHPPGARLDTPRARSRPFTRTGPSWPCDRSPGACCCRASTCRIRRFGTASPSAFRCWCIWNGAANRRLVTDLVRAGHNPGTDTYDLESL